MLTVCDWYVTVVKTMAALLSADADGVIHGSDDAL